MKIETFNNLINFEYPDDFVKLSDSENEKYFSGDLLRVSFNNTEKHALVSLSKTKDSFLNRLVGVASVIAGSLSNMEKNLKEFKVIEECESNICDRPTITECFSYTANDQNIKQYGEMSVFKYKSAFFIIYCICRFEDKESSKTIFKEFKDSFSLNS